MKTIIDKIGNNIDFKISCLNPTDFAKSNMLQAVDKNILYELAEVANKYNINRVYTFGPMSEKKIGCGQLAGNYQKM